MFIHPKIGIFKTQGPEQRVRFILSRFCAMCFLGFNWAHKLLDFLGLPEIKLKLLGIISVIFILTFWPGPPEGSHHISAYATLVAKNHWAHVCPEWNKQLLPVSPDYWENIVSVSPKVNERIRWVLRNHRLGLEFLQTHCMGQKCKKNNFLF